MVKLPKHGSHPRSWSCSWSCFLKNSSTAEAELCQTGPKVLVKTECYHFWRLLGWRFVFYVNSFRELWSLPKLPDGTPKAARSPYPQGGPLEHPEERGERVGLLRLPPLLLRHHPRHRSCVSTMQGWAFLNRNRKKIPNRAKPNRTVGLFGFRLRFDFRCYEHWCTLSDSIFHCVRIEQLKTPKFQHPHQCTTHHDLGFGPPRPMSRTAHSPPSKMLTTLSSRRSNSQSSIPICLPATTTAHEAGGRRGWAKAACESREATYRRTSSQVLRSLAAWGLSVHGHALCLLTSKWDAETKACWIHCLWIVSFLLRLILGIVNNFWEMWIC
jgi:hypothetical protein